MEESKNLVEAKEKIDPSGSSPLSAVVEPVAVKDGELEYGPLLRWAGGDNWRVEEDYKIILNGDSFIVNRGFIFDLASVPRIASMLLIPIDLGVIPSLAHDYLYRTGGGGFTRREVDDIFLRLMKKIKVRRTRRYLAWAAVRIFGWTAWRKLA